MYEIIHIQRGNILAGSMEMDLAIQMRTEMVGVSQHLPVGSIGRQAFKIFQLQWLVRRPWGGGNTERDCQVNELHGFAPV
jgi:hypothetical protein